MAEQRSEVIEQDKLQDIEYINFVMCSPIFKRNTLCQTKQSIYLHECYLQHCVHVVESLPMVEFVLCRVLCNSSGWAVFINTRYELFINK